MSRRSGEMYDEDGVLWTEDEDGQWGTNQFRCDGCGEVHETISHVKLYKRVTRRHPNGYKRKRGLAKYVN